MDGTTANAAVVVGIGVSSATVLEAFFMISSLASGTNLWPTLGNLLTSRWVIEFGDDAVAADVDAVGESNAVFFALRTSMVGNFCDMGTNR